MVYYLVPTQQHIDHPFLLERLNADSDTLPLQCHGTLQTVSLLKHQPSWRDTAVIIEVQAQEVGEDSCCS